jgi:hypothetical protein
MRRWFQFSLRTLLGAVCLTGPTLLVLPSLDLAGFNLIVVILCGMILLKAADKTQKM